MNKRLSIEVDENVEISSIFDKSTNVELISMDNSTAVLQYDGKIRGMIGGGVAKFIAKIPTEEYELTVKVVNDVCEKFDKKDNIFDAITVGENSKLLSRTDFQFGVDISSVYEVLRLGGKFYNQDGVRESVFSLLKKSGFDCIRLRLWNDPNFLDGTPYGGGHNNLKTNICIAKIAKAVGMKFMLDFHYSDFWADPAKQSIPKAWRKFTKVSEVENAIYAYTFNTLKLLKDNGIEPEFVQVGNEITNGMIQHNAYLNDDDISYEKKKIKGIIRGDFGCAAFLKYLNAGCNAVKEFNKNIQVVIHIDRGADNVRCNKFFRRIKAVNYDIMGLSYYSFFHGDIKMLEDNLTALVAKFDKPIIVAETSYAFTNEPNENSISVFSDPKLVNKNWDISPSGQAKMISDIVDVLLKLPKNRGVGVYYWEPCWLPVVGAGWAKGESKPSWSDQALISYDGIKLPSLDTPMVLKGKN